MSKARIVADLGAGVDLTPVKQDVGILAFQSARADNQSAFNLGNAFIDQFEDATGIDTTSSTERNASEFVSSSVDVETQIAQSNVATAASNGIRELAASAAFDGTRGGANYQAGVRADPSNIGWYISADWGSGNSYTVVGFKIWGVANYGIAGNTDNRYGKLQGSNDNSNWTTLYTIDNVAHNGPYKADLSASQTYPAHYIDSDAANFDRSTAYRYHRILFEGDGNGGTVSELEFFENVPTINATGNFTSVSQTASASVSSMSIIVMYEDTTGTATLNTDIVAQVSANNGTDFSTVTLSAAPSLSNTIKVAKSAAVAVTAGTQPKYKISFANQASGTKVTRILGVSLLY